MTRTDQTLTEELGRRIGYTFHSCALAVEAVTHRSRGLSNNERLEFLGDSVLNLAVSQLVFNRFPQHPEGELSRIRAALVNREALLRIAQNLRMGELLRLGEGELKSGGVGRPSILADAVEAIMGAVYRDGGFEKAEVVITQLVAPLLEEVNPTVAQKDSKTQLQEWLQARRHSLPRYKLLESRGEAHDKTFRIACIVDELKIHTEGEGKSRRVAEQLAARAAYDALPATSL